MAKDILNIRLQPYIFYAIFALLFLKAIFLLIIFFVPEGGFLIIQEIIGNKNTLFNLAIVTLFISAFNLVLAWIVFKKDKIASHIFGSLSIFIPAIILLKIASIIFMH